MWHPAPAACHGSLLGRWWLRKGAVREVGETKNRVACRAAGPLSTVAGRGPSRSGGGGELAASVGSISDGGTADILARAIASELNVIEYSTKC